MDGEGLKRAVPAQKVKRGIPGSTIKIIAVAAMLIDHIAGALIVRMLTEEGLIALDAGGYLKGALYWLLESGLIYIIYSVMRLIGRLGFPIFCFLLVEGFQKTGNLKKYILRLGLFALISEVPFDLAFSGRFLEFGYQNVYFTLFIGILALCAFDILGKCELTGWRRALPVAVGILIFPLYAAFAICSFLSVSVSASMAGGLDIGAGRVSLPVFACICLTCCAVLLIVLAVYRAVKGPERVWRLCGNLVALAAAMWAADLLYTDYAGMGVLTIAVMYGFRRRKAASMTAGCAVLTVMSPSEITAFFALIPIALYNGERGLKLKYFFYAFYPVHLLIIWLIALAMGMGWIPVV